MFSIDKDTKIVTLIHAGQPECYYHVQGQNEASIANLNNRARSEYLNSNYATNAHNMIVNEALSITESDEATTNDLRYIGSMGTSLNNSHYYLATAIDSGNLWGVYHDGSINSKFAYNVSLGIRPVIVLKSNILTIGKGTDMVGQEAWALVKP